MNAIKFEGTCMHCKQTIRSGDGGWNWRHVRKPAGEKHYAAASGVIKQI